MLDIKAIQQRYAKAMGDSIEPLVPRLEASVKDIPALLQELDKLRRMLAYPDESIYRLKRERGLGR